MGRIYFETLSKGHSKSSKPHAERRSIAEHFCRGNTLPLLIKLEKLIRISVFITVQVRPITNVWYERKI